MALCLLDLDQLRTINDTEGTTSVTRCSGDEFAVLIPFHGGTDVACGGAPRLRRTLAPMTHGISLTPRGSIGVASTRHMGATAPTP